MAQTVIVPNTTQLTRGVLQVTGTIPTTVDTTGATLDFQLPRIRSASFQAVSSNFNGKTVSLQGAPDGTNYAELPTAASLTATGVKSVALADTAYYNYRINCTGTPTVAVVVTLIANVDV